MQIEFVNVSPTAVFAGASHQQVVDALVAASTLVATHGPEVRIRFDARYVHLLDLCLEEPLDDRAVRFVRADDIVMETTHDADDDVDEIELDALPIDSPMGHGLVERGFVDLLLERLEGVTLHDPARIWIEHDVRVDPGAVIWGGAVLRGSTHVGAAEIGPGAVLVDTRVADGAIIKPYTVCEGAHIGPDAQVGPMAHLRPKARLSVGVKVGNFVEVKNTTLHANAKASHLTYLGDAEIGEGANIGAGTITCNYDGFNKWKTVIGAGAFIGSNSALVAPVTIHEGAIVAAGSTINQDVPADALAICRAEQKNLPKMGARIRNKNRSLKERAGG